MNLHLCSSTFKGSCFISGSLCQQYIKFSLCPFWKKKKSINPNEPCCVWYCIWLFLFFYCCSFLGMDDAKYWFVFLQSYQDSNIHNWLTVGTPSEPDNPETFHWGQKSVPFFFFFFFLEIIKLCILPYI